MEKKSKEELEKLSREEKLEYVRKTVTQMTDIIGSGSDIEDLSDIYLSNSQDSDTCTGQNYEDLAIAYICFSRFLDNSS